MPITVILTQIMIIIAEIAAGVMMEKRGLIDEPQSSFLSSLVMELFLPCSLLANANIEAGKGTIRNLLLGALALEILYLAGAGLCKLLAKRVKLSDDDLPAFIGTTVLPNSAFIGIPMLTSILGNELGMVYAASGIIAYNVYFFTYLISQFQKGSDQKRGFLENLKNLMTTTNAATAVMIVMLLAGLRFPAPVQSILSQIGACTTPVALMICGVILAKSSILEMAGNRFLYLVTFLKNLAFPLVLMLALRLLPLDRTMCFAITILAACPSGSLSVVAAKQYHKGEKLASQAVAHSTAFMMVTAPLVLMAAGKVFGVSL